MADIVTGLFDVRNICWNISDSDVGWMDRLVRSNSSVGDTCSLPIFIVLW